MLCFINVSTQVSRVLVILCSLSSSPWWFVESLSLWTRIVRRCLALPINLATVEAFIFRCGWPKGVCFLFLSFCCTSEAGVKILHKYVLHALKASKAWHGNTYKICRILCSFGQLISPNPFSLCRSCWTCLYKVNRCTERGSRTKELKQDEIGICEDCGNTKWPEILVPSDRQSHCIPFG